MTRLVDVSAGVWLSPDSVDGVLLDDCVWPETACVDVDGNCSVGVGSEVSSACEYCDRYRIPDCEIGRCVDPICWPEIAVMCGADAFEGGVVMSEPDAERGEHCSEASDFMIGSPSCSFPCVGRGRDVDCGDLLCLDCAKSVSDKVVHCGGDITAVISILFYDGLVSASSELDWSSREIWADVCVGIMAWTLSEVDRECYDSHAIVTASCLGLNCEGTILKCVSGTVYALSDCGDWCAVAESVVLVMMCL